MGHGGSGNELGPAATLSHVADQAHPDIYSRAWAEWRDVIEDFPPTEPVSGAPAMNGFGGTSVPCRIVMPEGELRAMLVEAPDADNQWRPTQAMLDRGVGVFQVGLRGCSVGEEPPMDWACEGLGEGFDRGQDVVNWRVMQAAGDVASAVLSCGLLGVPVYARGRSLGGGLLVLALAGLAGQATIERVVLELPGLGDWTWRWAQASKASLSGKASPANGIGSELLSYASRFPARRSQLYDSLRIIDAALAAPKLHGSTLCKLALHDAVVPAPTAAAVFNAIGTDTGNKWRFVVPTGHSAQDMASNRRHAQFERCATDFLDPANTPSSSMRAWEEAMRSDADEPSSSEQTQQSTLFGDASQSDTDLDTDSDTDSELIRAYEAAGRTLDDLPYTAEFDAIYAAVSSDTAGHERNVFHRLHTLRKSGRLPRLGRGTSSPPAISTEHEALLGELVVGALGKLSLRDRLPYTPEFDALVSRFNSSAGLALGPHEVWRLVAKLAK